MGSKIYGRKSVAIISRSFDFKSTKVLKKIGSHNSVLFRACLLFFFLSSQADHDAITRENPSAVRYNYTQQGRENYCDVIIEAFNEDRFPLLARIINQYRTCHCIKSVYLRTNFSTRLTQRFLHDVHPSTYQLIVTQSDSLNERFRIPTRSTSSCVIIADDDILVSADDLTLLHQVWLDSPYSLVGPFSRKISSLRNEPSALVYEDSSSEYNLILTKLLFVHKMYMERYHSKRFRDLRQIVDEFHNCEDIAINIVAALLNGHPLHVDVRPLDLGDSRNDNTDLYAIRRRGIGLLPNHWARRHECFRRMFRLYHHLPRLQTVSVNKFIGENSLCFHAGEKIPCRDIPSK